MSIISIFYCEIAQNQFFFFVCNDLVIFHGDYSMTRYARLQKYMNGFIFVFMIAFSHYASSSPII